jgi:DNA polymerase-3 subunit delta'
MKFSQIHGHGDIISKLIRSVNEQRVSHAQLFSGPPGCGSLSLALAYAQYVSCENRSATDSCGTCKSCFKYEKYIHPDLHFVFPVIKGKKNDEPVSDTYIEEWRTMLNQKEWFTINDWLDSIEVGNAQGLIFSSEAGEIIKKLSLKTFEADYKIMIIWLPEKMHPSTANKLLKLLEEPPDKTLFLLVTDEPDKILPTILSRCQLIKIPGFTPDELTVYLTDKYGLPREKAADIAGICNGSIIRAGELASADDPTLQNLDRFRALMRFAWKRDVNSLIAWSEETASTGREAQKGFLSYSLRILRENLMLTLGQKQNNLVFLSGEESSFSTNFHPFITPQNIESLSGEITLAFSHIEANGNAKIIFLDLALKITKLIQQKPAG